MEQKFAVEKAVSTINDTIKEFEHRIEMMIVEARKDKEPGSAKEVPNDDLEDSLLGMHQELMREVGGVTAALTTDTVEGGQGE
jgi:hypothetical protein